MTPSDVQSRIPYKISSSPLGEGPNYLSVGKVLEFAWNTLVALGNALYDLADNLYQAGIKFIGEIGSTAQRIINDAVAAIQNAFDAFVTWAINFVCNALRELIAQPLQALYNGIESWAMGLVSLINSASMSIQGGANNESASIDIYHYIADSVILKLPIIVGISLLSVVTAVSFLGPYGFLAAMVAPLLVDMLIQGMTAAAFSMVGMDNIATWIARTIGDILGDDLVVGMAGIMGATIGTIGWLASMMMLDTTFSAIKGFVWSSIGAILSWVGTLIADWTQSMILGIFGLALSIKGCYEVFLHPDLILRANPTALNIMKGVTAIEAGISIFELTTTVASHE